MPWGLIGFHLFLLISVPHVVGIFAVSTTILGDLLIAGFLLTMAHRAVRGYARHAWLQGYATGHWDGLEDAGTEGDFSSEPRLQPGLGSLPAPAPAAGRRRCQRPAGRPSNALRSD